MKMSDDRFEEKAKEIAYGYKGYDPEQLAIKIAEALREEAKTTLVSEGDEKGNKKHGVRAGMNIAMELRATEDLKAKWPSEQELDDRLRKHEGTGNYAVYNIGMRDCYLWLKERLMK